jgi:hypothetical protein
MKLFIFFTLLNITALPLSYGHFKVLPQKIKIIFSKGENWNNELSYNKQLKVGDHINFLKKLYKSGFIYLGYVEKKTSFNTLILQNLSKSDFTKKISKNPIISNKILSYKVEDIVITMKQSKTHGHSH